MPDSEALVVPGDGRTVVALAERMAVVETRVGSLQGDAAVIRSTLHEINNQAQKFVAAEQLCAINLGRVIETQTTTSAHITRLTTAVDGLTVDRARLDGAWQAISHTAILIGSVLGGLAVVVAAIMWSLGHLALKVTS